MFTSLAKQFEIILLKEAAFTAKQTRKLNKDSALAKTAFARIGLLLSLFMCFYLRRLTKWAS